MDSGVSGASRDGRACRPHVAQTTGQLCQTGPHAVKSREPGAHGAPRPTWPTRLGSLPSRARRRSAAPVPRSRTISGGDAMRRRPSRLVAVTAAVLALTGCEARVYGTPPPVDPDAPQLTVVAPQGPLAPLPEAPPDEPAVVLRRPGRSHQAGHGRRRRQAAPTSPPSCWTATPANWSPTATARPSPSPRWSSCSSPTTCCCRWRRARPTLAGRPQVVRRHAAVLRRQRRRGLLEPQRRQRDHHPGRRALRARRRPARRATGGGSTPSARPPTWCATTT